MNADKIRHRSPNNAIEHSKMHTITVAALNTRQRKVNFFLNDAQLDTETVQVTPLRRTLASSP